MKFEEVIKALQDGGTAWRKSWGSGMEIVRQIPQCVAKEIVPKMTSLPGIVKSQLNETGNGEISYHDQVIIISFADDGSSPSSATYYFPSWEDIFAENWCVKVPVNDDYKERMKQEFYELVARLEKLDKFLVSETFKGLSLKKQSLLREQMEAMISYREALGQRCDLEGIKL